MGAAYKEVLMQSDPRITTPAVSTNENMLHTLGRKVSAGRELTLAEDLMARTAAARFLRGNYGPGPAEMQVSRLELPESVKGLLASYAGV